MLPQSMTRRHGEYGVGADGLECGRLPKEFAAAVIGSATSPERRGARSHSRWRSPPVWSRLRAPLWDLPLERDEGEYAYIAWRMAAGETPYLRLVRPEAARRVPRVSDRARVAG